jgi:hypothetical protein
MEAAIMGDLLEIPACLRRKKSRKKKAVVAPYGEGLHENVVDPDELKPFDLPDDLRYHQVYYVRGTAPKQWRAKGAPYFVKDPPNSGYSAAFLIGKPGAKNVTIFCPFTLEASAVPADCAEVRDCKQLELSVAGMRRLVAIMRTKWDMCQRFGYLRSYDVAALVLKRLGEPVPADLLKGGETDDRVRGGKPVSDELLKPVKRAGKRGKFLEWFLAENGPRSILEGMAELDMGRSNVLSYLFMLNKDHGLGYSLVGGRVEILLPDGCNDPFDTPTEDDSWLD